MADNYGDSDDVNLAGMSRDDTESKEDVLQELQQALIPGLTAAEATNLRQNGGFCDQDLVAKHRPKKVSSACDFRRTHS
jgi:hypothetical protein